MLTVPQCKDCTGPHKKYKYCRAGASSFVVVWPCIATIWGGGGGSPPVLLIQFQSGMI